MIIIHCLPMHGGNLPFWDLPVPLESCKGLVKNIIGRERESFKGRLLCWVARLTEVDEDSLGGPSIEAKQHQKPLPTSIPFPTHLGLCKAQCDNTQQSPHLKHNDGCSENRGGGIHETHLKQKRRHAAWMAELCSSDGQVRLLPLHRSTDRCLRSRFFKQQPL